LRFWRPPKFWLGEDASTKASATGVKVSAAAETESKEDDVSATMHRMAKKSIAIGTRLERGIMPHTLVPQQAPHLAQHNCRDGTNGHRRRQAPLPNAGCATIRLSNYVQLRVGERGDIRFPPEQLLTRAERREEQRGYIGLTVNWFGRRDSIQKEGQYRRSSIATGTQVHQKKAIKGACVYKDTNTLPFAFTEGPTSS
jgi:hypothetical protein